MLMGRKMSLQSPVFLKAAVSPVVRRVPTTGGGLSVACPGCWCMKDFEVSKVFSGTVSVNIFVNLKGSIW